MSGSATGDEGMLRVLMLTSRFPDRLRPSLGNFIQRQAVELSARPGVEVEIVAPIGRSPFPFARSRSQGLEVLPVEETWKGLKVHRPRFTLLPVAGRLRPESMERTLLPLLRKIRERFPFDLISAEFSWPDGPAASALGRSLGVPVMIKARGAEFEHNAVWASTRRQLLDACRSAAGLLAISESVKQAMVDAGLPAERIAVHYPAVDSSLFRIGGRAAEKAKLGISGPLLLCVGNLIPIKGHRLAVEALASVPEATLLIAGGGPEFHALNDRARALGVADRLSLEGSIPHGALPSLFAAADVTIHPSLKEGFGNVRLESLSCGTPLVTTAAGDGERIVDRPAAGRVVPPDPGAIAEAVLSLLADPPTPQAVRESALFYSWERQSVELESHLRELVFPKC